MCDLESGNKILHYRRIKYYRRNALKIKSVCDCAWSSVRRLAGDRCKQPRVELPGKASLKRLHSMSLEGCGTLYKGLEIGMG